MSKTALVALRRQIDEKCQSVKAIWDKSDADQNGELTADQRGEVVKLNKEIEDLELRAKDLLGDVELRNGNDRRLADLKTSIINPITHPEGGGGGRTERKTPGQLFVEDAQVRDYLAKLAPNGVIPDRVAIHTPGVQMKSLITGASDTSAGALVVTDRKPILDPGTLMRPLTLRDLVTQGETGSDLVEYVRQTSLTNNAAPVAEATATAGSSGLKPESAMALAIIQEAVKTIAHWIPATRRALADVPQLRTLIDTILMYGLDEELEDQMVNGAGTGENFTGVLNVSGITTQAYDTDILKTTRKARTKVRTTGRAMATAYAMNPSDWEAFDLLKDGESRYYFGGPSVLGNPRLWGLPVVECEAFTAGTAMVADWRLAVLWDRMVSTILASTEHADFFVRNLVAVLAEMRAAFGVIRPAAFVSIDLTP